MVWNRELSQINKNKTWVSLNSKLTFSINVEHFSTQSSTFELMLKIIIIFMFLTFKTKSIQFDSIFCWFQDLFTNKVYIGFDFVLKWMWIKVK